jgi:hypothetical protein
MREKKMKCSNCGTFLVGEGTGLHCPWCSTGFRAKCPNCARLEEQLEAVYGKTTKLFESEKRDVE